MSTNQKKRKRGTKKILEGYVGDYYEIAEIAEHIFIGSELPEEYTESECRKSLMSANAKAKANAATAIPELVQIASNSAFEENQSPLSAPERPILSEPMSLT